ncbi:MAG: hypothetical protein AMS15_03260 [Planctomycetes bacterium DG_23]|nr:MAG: hypothetical protein AMS15_03260 [Planctomycetes bacterium DG_23]
MPNFFEDNEDIKFHLETRDLEAIIRLQEEDFKEKGEFPYAPEDVADAQDNYRRVLHLLGQIAAEFIEPRAEEVDLEGPKLVEGKVVYSEGIAQALGRLAQADLMGMLLPRQYGGLNFPTTIYAMAIEIISRADASLMNIFGLGSIAETIDDYASEELKEKYLPKFASGEVTGAMALTEPDAGSDLQACRLKATEDTERDSWRLSGVKRFITNGCGDVLLVLGRSEEGSEGGLGLSLFLCEQGPGLRVRRLEDKLGIHGSPTCELHFDNKEAFLVGERRLGLIRYAMSMMNGARIAVAAQAVGIAEAAYRRAMEFAGSREQFGRKVRDFPAVSEMLTQMRVSIEAARALLYDTAMVADLFRGLQRQFDVAAKEEKKEIRGRLNKVKRLAGMLAPMSKYYASEMSIKVASDAIQVHGGSGYMKDYPVERYFRDARITSIYEGTSQLQIIAAMGGLTSGTFSAALDEFEFRGLQRPLKGIFGKLLRARKATESAISYIKKRGDSQYTDLKSSTLVDMAIDTYIGYLLLRDAELCKRKVWVAKKFIEDMLPRVEMNAKRVRSGARTTLTHFSTINA